MVEGYWYGGGKDGTGYGMPTLERGGGGSETGGGGMERGEGGAAGCKRLSGVCRINRCLRD